MSYNRKRSISYNDSPKNKTRLTSCSFVEKILIGDTNSGFLNSLTDPVARQQLEGYRYYRTVVNMDISGPFRFSMIVRKAIESGEVELVKYLLTPNIFLSPTNNIIFTYIFRDIFGALTECYNRKLTNTKFDEIASLVFRRYEVLWRDKAIGISTNSYELLNYIYESFLHYFKIHRQLCLWSNKDFRMKIFEGFLRTTDHSVNIKRITDYREELINKTIIPILHKFGIPTDIIKHDIICYIYFL